MTPGTAGQRRAKESGAGGSSLRPETLGRRIALGTAQLGMAYGVANQAGEVDHAQAAAILGQARAGGIDTLDTAMAYGQSESRLGAIGVDGWRVITKLPGIRRSESSPERWVRQSISDSLARLGQSQLAAVLLHRPSDLLGADGEQIYAALKNLQAAGMVAKIGVSIYDPQELDPLLRRYSLDIVQAPLNVLDRRLVHSGWLHRLHHAGLEIHVRSVFLQGLLLIPPDARPDRFKRWAPALDAWDRWLAEERITPLRGCLGFVTAFPELDRIVVGVDSARQLDEILRVVAEPRLTPPDALSQVDLNLIDPSRWTVS